MGKFSRCRRRDHRERSLLGETITGGVVALLLSLAAPAAGAPPLGDLTIPANRVPDWFMPPEPPNTSGWTVVNVQAANCNGTSATNDRTAIQAAITAAAANTIIQLDGTPGSPCIYNMRSGNTTINKSRLVLRGGGMAATNLKLHAPGMNVSIDGPTSSVGPTNWTAGYARGTTTVTVASTAGITAGDWIYLEAAFPAELGVGNACTPGPALLNPRNMAIEKVVSVNSGAGTITFDRGLRNDFSNAVVCQQTVTKMNPISRSGIESMTITTVNPDDVGWAFMAPTNVVDAVESWVRDVKYVGSIGPQAPGGTTYQNQFIQVVRSARILLDQLWVSKLRHWKWGEAAITLGLRSYESAVINSVLEGLHADVKFEGGSSGNIWAYNFSRCEPATDCTERSTFLHGLANEVLVEGNDLEVKSEHDNYWGPQQYRNTWYRNRFSTNPAHRKPGYSVNSVDWGISAQLVNSQYPMSPLANFMLNVASSFHSSGPLGNFDVNNHATTSQYWIERNLVEGLLRLIPKADTQSVSNVTSATTTRGVGDWTTKTYPASLVYASKPSWWLSTPWPAIGADVDVIGSGMRKLPAQCRYEGSTTGDCAAPAAPLGVPGRPVLVP